MIKLMLLGSIDINFTKKNNKHLLAVPEMSQNRLHSDEPRKEKEVRKRFWCFEKIDLHQIIPDISLYKNFNRNIIRK